jgi:hypothetical protein
MDSRLSTAGQNGCFDAAWRHRYGPGCHDAEELICKKSQVIVGFRPPGTSSGKRMFRRSGYRFAAKNIRQA